MIQLQPPIYYPVPNGLKSEYSIDFSVDNIYDLMLSGTFQGTAVSPISIYFDNLNNNQDVTYTMGGMSGKIPAYSTASIAINGAISIQFQCPGSSSSQAVFDVLNYTISYGTSSPGRGISPSLNNYPLQAPSYSILGSNKGAGYIGFSLPDAQAPVVLLSDKLKEFVSVRDWGAVGDGVTDDTALIQDVLANHDNVLIPASFSFVITSLNLKSNQTLILAGNLLSKAGNQDMLVNTAQASDINIIGMGGYLDGNKANGSGTARAIFLSNVQRVKITGVKVQNVYWDGISVYDGTDVRITDNYVVNVGANGIKAQSANYATSGYLIARNTVKTTGSQNGIFTYGVSAMLPFTDFIVTENIVEDTGDEGIEIGLNCYDGSVVANRIKHAHSDGILVRGAQRVTVTGNSVSGSQNGSGIYIWRNTGGGDPQCQNITVSGNTCTGCKTANRAGIMATASSMVNISGNTCAYNNLGIYDVQSYDMVVNGNNCDANDGDGIVIEDTINFLVANNNCKDNNQANSANVAYSGIRLTANTATPYNGKVTNNRCYDDQSTPTQQNGIYYYQCENTEISHNWLVGNKNAAIYNAGGNNSNLWSTKNQTTTAAPIIPYSWVQGAITMNNAQGFDLNQAVPQATFGDKVDVIYPGDLQGVTVTAYVSSAGNITVSVRNNTGATVTLGAANWTAIVTKAAYL